MKPEAELIALLARRFDVPADAIGPDDLLTDIVPGSFALIELLVELQETRGLRLSQEDLPALRTVGDVAALLAGSRAR